MNIEEKTTEAINKKRCSNIKSNICKQQEEEEPIYSEVLSLLPNIFVKVVKYG